MPKVLVISLTVSVCASLPWVGQGPQIRGIFWASCPLSWGCLLLIPAGYNRSCQEVLKLP